MSAVADFELQSLYPRNAGSPPFLTFPPTYSSQVAIDRSLQYSSETPFIDHTIMPATRASKRNPSPLKEDEDPIHKAIGEAVRSSTYEMNGITPNTPHSDIPWRLIDDLTKHFVSKCPTLNTSSPEASKYDITAHLRLGDDENELQCGVKIDEWSVQTSPDGQVSVIHLDYS
jgi:hypothetical protein